MRSIAQTATFHPLNLRSMSKGSTSSASHVKIYRALNLSNAGRSRFFPSFSHVNTISTEDRECSDPNVGPTLDDKHCDDSSTCRVTFETARDTLWNTLFPIEHRGLAISLLSTIIKARFNQRHSSGSHDDDACCDLVSNCDTSCRHRLILLGPCAAFAISPSGWHPSTLCSPHDLAGFIRCHDNGRGHSDHE